MSESAIEAMSEEGPSVAEFRATMPADYGKLYSPEETAEHAVIVQRRRLEPAHVELGDPSRAAGQFCASSPTIIQVFSPR